MSIAVSIRRMVSKHFVLSFLLLLGGSVIVNAQNLGGNSLPPPTAMNPSGIEELPPPASTAETVGRMEGLTVVKIQDITKVLGYRENEVENRGLVVGLFNSGGRSPNTLSARMNLLEGFGLDARVDNARSTSFVNVQADIPAFARVGEEIQAIVSTLDDATDLKGGTLMTCQLLGPDGEVYATASGPLVAGGFAVSGAAGGVAKNHPTTATVRARIQKEICVEPNPNNREITIFLEGPKKDPVTAARIATAVNRLFPNHAKATDPGSITIQIPETFRSQQVEFISLVRNLEVIPNVPARVVINQKTGTIVMGNNVKISRVMFANDNLIITMNENPEVSQPNPFGQGNTVVVPRTQIAAIEQGGNFNVISEGITVGELAQALNALGVTPQDLINILQALREQGSLHAELVEQ